MIIGTPFEDHIESKRKQAKAVAAFVTEHHAIKVMFVSDVWMRSVPGDAAQEEINKRPSRQPDAIEAIIAQVWLKDGTQYAVCRQYRQNDMGQLDILEQKVMEGPFENITFQPILDALYS